MDYANIPIIGVKRLDQRLLEAQKLFQGPKKNAINPFLKNSYADLGAVIAVVKEQLLTMGVFIEQECRVDAAAHDWLNVTTILTCPETKQSKAFNVSVRLKEMSPQGSMGAFTYGRRYGLKAAFNMVDQDDDANEASGFEIPGTNKKTEKTESKTETKKPNALDALVGKKS